MASIEYITKRIAGKEKEIDKLQKKLARIEKAEATGWEVNPYYYNERDKRYTIKDLEEAKEALAKYRDELAIAQEKAESRDVKAILDFLAGWKNRVREFYLRSFLAYQQEHKEWLEYDAKHSEWINNGGWRDPNREAINKEYKERRNAHYERWNFLFHYIEREINAEHTHYVEVMNAAKLNKDLDQEADAMYDDIIERTNKITGKITDASALEVGEKGELNGYIKGERGIAKVHTIGAGGYNIQRFHFRTLVHEAK